MNNFTAQNTPVVNCTPGSTIAMQAAVSAATAADAGTFRVYLMVFDPTGKKIYDHQFYDGPLTTTPQTVSGSFTLPTTSPTGVYQVLTSVRDAAFAWQNVSQTGASFTVAPPNPTSLVKVSGDDQGGTIGIAQPQPMIVQARDATGAPFPNATINWSTTAGTLSTATSQTDANGNASATFTNPTTPQTSIVTAAVGSLSVTFSQTAHIPLYGAHSAFPTLLKPAGIGDPLAGVGFIPDDGLAYSLVTGASDEFNGAALDTTKWWKRYKDNTGSLDHYNNELQRYNDNHVLSNGLLQLTATPKVPAQTFTAPNGAVFPLYDSQMIRSRTLIKYGYIECRAKQPPGVGIWPAFWILPQVGAKPELDIMDDAKNGTHEFWNMTHSNVGSAHTQKVWLEKNKSYQYNFWKAPAPLSPTYFPDDFHVWSLLWDPTTVTSYIDGQPVSQWALVWANDSGVDPGGASVIANLAMGDAWATDNWTVQPVTTPQTYAIDYIRVWQRADIAFTAVSPV